MGFTHFILPALLILVNLAESRPAYLSNYLIVSNLSVYQPCPLGASASTNASINFTVQDPNPSANKSAVCRGQWATNSTSYPTGPYVACEHDYAWNFQDAGYRGPQDFTLQIEHIFEDPSVGQFPYDVRSEFAHITINSTILPCFGAVNEITVCKQPANRLFQASIYIET